MSRASADYGKENLVEVNVTNNQREFTLRIVINWMVLTAWLKAMVP
jgi:hypothetical protein